MSAGFWTEEREAAFRRFVDAGESYSTIGARLGCSRSAAIGKGMRLGIRRRENRAPRRNIVFSSADLLRLKALVAEGHTISQISRMLGKNRATVRSRILSEGLDVPPDQRKGGLNGGAVGAILRHAAEKRTGRPAPHLPGPAKAAAKDYDAARLADAVPLADLDRGCCRFAVTANDVAPDGHLFCAEVVVDRLAAQASLEANYCAHHAARMRAA